MCFKLIFVNPAQKKTLPVPIGAGGFIEGRRAAISLHTEINGVGDILPGGVVVDQCTSASHDLHGHRLLDGFSSTLEDPALEEANVCT